MPAPEGLRSFHFVGIGGAGMSGIALVLHSRGYEVTGSDLKPSRYVTLLEDAGHPGEHRSPRRQPDHPDVVVISSAIPEHNVELREARRRGILVVKRAQALAWLMEAGRGIAVCGTHGKTTTTSMISRVLVDAGYDPTFLVGGELNDLGSNARHGEGEFVVCEADESDGSLLLLSPEVAVLTNMELDHHSHYLHVEDVEQVFRRVHRPAAARWSTRLLGGRLRGWRRWPTRAVPRAAPTARSDGADYQAREVVPLPPGQPLRGLAGRGHRLRGRPAVPGKHNVLNALACFATLVGTGRLAGADRPGAGRLHGRVRRFQWKGERDGVTVVDDYAHHPTELNATLRAARDGRVVAGDRRLPAAPLLAHRVPARRVRRSAARGRRGRGHRRLRGARGPAAGRQRQADRRQPAAPGEAASPWSTCPGWRPMVDYLDRATCPGDLVLTLGAGDVHRVGERFLAPA